jgi:hypothetical protein
MDRFCLTDWLTVRGAGPGVATITQGENAWLDLSAYDDVIFYLDIKEVSGSSVTLTYQTSPSKDDASFQAILPPITMAAGTRVDLALAKYAAVPVARYVRWQITNGSTYDATFRVLVAAA